MRVFRVAYDGRPFSGFQRQPDVSTVEGTLFSGLRRLGVLDDDEAKPSRYAAAGRTDAGVSSLAQTVAFDCPDWCTPRALNSELPGSIRAWAHADAPGYFHATLDATNRTYTYLLFAPLDGLAAATIDDDRAREALDALSGEHDFHNLTTDDENTVRSLSGSLDRAGEFLVIRVTADGFARGLVRRVVSLVSAVGTGESPLDRVDRLLGPDPVDGADGVGPAPPTPLVLTDVRYPSLRFETDADAVESARTVFTDRYAEARVAARVSRTLVEGLRDYHPID